MPVIEVKFPQFVFFLEHKSGGFLFGAVFKHRITTESITTESILMKTKATETERDKFDSTEKMPTLSEKINKALEQGYTENFKITARGLSDEMGSKYYLANEIHIPNFHRFEGYSDPQDNAILYWIETTDGRKGILMDAYGAYSDVKVSDFIREVEAIQKNKK